MDQPTPFPGKTRQITSTKREDNPIKNSKEAQAITSRYRQKRAFGVSRNTNIIVTIPEKPVKPAVKISTRLKPSGPSSKLDDSDSLATKPKTLKPAIRTGDALVGNAENSADKIKGKPRKLSVCFQEPPEKSQAKNVPEDGDSTSTPFSLIKRGVVGTPYQSAENCSKCRFDKLESSTYWIAQIKMAESVGKHFVSVAFFRLALQCNAKPLRSLCSELKRYVARHDSLYLETAWRDAFLSYGLPIDEAKVKCSESDSPKETALVVDENSACLTKTAAKTEISDEMNKTNSIGGSTHSESDAARTPSVKISKKVEETNSLTESKQSDNDVALEQKDMPENKDIDGIENCSNGTLAVPVPGKPRVGSRSEFPSSNKTSDPCGGTKKPLCHRNVGKLEGGNVLGKQSPGDKADRVNLQSSDDSPCNCTKLRSIDTVHKAGETMKPGKDARLSYAEPAQSRSGARGNQRDPPRGTEKVDGQGSSSQLCITSHSIEASEDATPKQLSLQEGELVES